MEGKIPFIERNCIFFHWWGGFVVKSTLQFLPETLCVEFNRMILSCSDTTIQDGWAIYLYPTSPHRTPLPFLIHIHRLVHTLHLQWHNCIPFQVAPAIHFLITPRGSRSLENRGENFPQGKGLLFSKGHILYVYNHFTFVDNLHYAHERSTTLNTIIKQLVFFMFILYCEN